MAAVEWQMAAKEEKLNPAPAIHAPPPHVQRFTAGFLPVSYHFRQQTHGTLTTKHLEPFHSTKTVYEPGYPHPFRFSWDTRSGLVANRAL